MVMKCERCGREISEGQAYGHLGETLCDDCYLDVRWPVTSCDSPCDSAAADSASGPGKGRGFKGIGNLTELQRVIYQIIAGKGRVTWEELAADLNVPGSELHDPLAMLKLHRLVEDHREGDRIYLVDISTADYLTGSG